MVSRAWARAAIAAMGLLPLNALSRVGGRLATLRLPAPLQRAEIRLVGGMLGVAFDEARDPIDSFACFQDFFTRALRDGARPLDPAPDAFLSPCDGAWGSAGTVTGGTILQVKGRSYSVASLLGSEDDARAFEGGTFATFYLSPRDYHRFHAPAGVTVTGARYLPGTLWPVNGLGLEGKDGLFAENERICAHMQLEGTSGSL
jgi:phosphatidylserine decarboxylase